MTSANPRNISSELNVLSKADGSALFSQGNTVALASLYGPLEVRHQRIQKDGIPVLVTFKPKCGKQGIYDKTFEATIQSACEALVFPKQFCRFEILITIQEMQDDGSLLATAINAACLALINSGVEMPCLVAASTCALDKQGNFVIDPDKETSEEAEMLITVGFENVNYNIIATYVEGVYNIEAYETAVLLCRNSVKNIFDYYKSVVQKYSASL